MNDDMYYFFPRLSDPKEFERLVRDYCDVVYPGDYSLYGRSGQKQYGVDIISCDGKVHGQVKNFPVDKKEIDRICQQYQKRDGKKFIIATSGDRDTKIQDYIQELQLNYNVSIHILFWDDFEEFLSNHSNIWTKYYPNYDPSNIITTFEEIVEKYYISIIISYDPCVGNFPYKYACYLDYFNMECGRLLQKNIRKQKNPGFKEINKFRNLLDQYNDFLSNHFTPPPIEDPKDCFLGGVPFFMIDKFQDRVMQYRREIASLYYKITGKHLTLGEIQ